MGTHGSDSLCMADGDAVLLTGHDRHLEERLIDEQALSATFADPVRTAEAERLQALEREVEQLHEAMRSQRQIGVALGMLAHRYDCSVDQSWQLLTRVSQNTNVKVRVIAQLVADIFEGRTPDAEPHVLAALATQLPGQGDVRAPAAW